MTAAPLRDVAGASVPALAGRSLSEIADLALGKYVRAGSGRGHLARAGPWSTVVLDDVAQDVIAGRGEVLFVGLLIFLPRSGVPDLQVIDRADHHALLGE